MSKRFCYYCEELHNLPMWLWHLFLHFKYYWNLVWSYGKPDADWIMKKDKKEIEERKAGEKK